MATNAEELLEGQEELEPETPVADLEEPESPAGDGLSPGSTAGDDFQDPETDRQPEFNLVDRLQEMGFEDIDEKNGVTRLLESYDRQQRQLNELRQRVNQYEPLANQYLAQVGRQQEQPAAPKEEMKPWWSPPKFESGWMERYREANPDLPGQYRWKQDTPAEVIANTQAYQQYIQDWAENLTSRPHEVLPPIIEKVVQPLFEQWYEERRGSETTGSFVDDIRSKHADWLYEKDPVTNRPTDRLSAEGQRAMEYASEAEERGIHDPRDQWNYVEQMRELERLRKLYNRDSKSETAKERAGQKRAEHRRRGVAAQSIPSRGGSARSREEPQNSNISPGRQLVEALIEDGAQF